MFGKNYSWSLCVAKIMYKIFGVIVFESVVAVAFYLEMHQNNAFLFFKNYFLYKCIKMIWKHQTNSNLKQRKNKKFQFF
jgi:predicted tellurium resistance membrane protein TerC